MIRSHFGLEANPFDPSVNDLLPHQQEVFDVLCVHARQAVSACCSENPALARVPSSRP